MAIRDRPRRFPGASPSTLPVAACLALAASAAATPARADLHLLLTRDLSTDPSIGTGFQGDDLSPALAGTAADGVWLTWYRAALDLAPTAPVSLAHATDTSGMLTITQTPANARVAAIGVAHDGADPVVFYATTLAPGGTLTADIYAWRPRAAPTVMRPILYSLSAAVHQMSVAPFGNLAHFDIGIATALPQVETIEATATAGYASFSSSGRTYMTSFGVAAARARGAGNSLFAILGRGTNPNAVVFGDTTGGNVVTPLSSQPLAVAAAHTMHGEFRVAVVVNGSTLNQYVVPIGSLTPSTTRSTILATSNLHDVALAQDDRTGGAWTAALSTSPETLWVSDDVAPPAPIPVAAGYGPCTHLQAATTGTLPDVLFATASCRNAAGVQHVLFFVLQRDPPAITDAGADAAVDAASSEDVVASEDAATDVSPTLDVAVADAAFDADAMPEQDSAPGARSGPAFRGSGCACRTSGADHRAPFGVSLMLVLLASVGVRRRARPPSRQ